MTCHILLQTKEKTKSLLKQKKNQTIEGFGVSEVLDSNDPNLRSIFNPTTATDLVFTKADDGNRVRGVKLQGARQLGTSILQWHCSCQKSEQSEGMTNNSRTEATRIAF
uniref:Uncharacterized protein n=1 Tax=Tanacetum cinerariifolium TaxID=118510 RepID=A0A6L2JLN4_TANCI|nr:hypothetical protein [Tanacetum cinerariifolium]